MLIKLTNKQDLTFSFAYLTVSYETQRKVKKREFNNLKEKSDTFYK